MPQSLTPPPHKTPLSGDPPTFYVDVGGTFADAVDSRGKSVKVLTTGEFVVEHLGDGQCRCLVPDLPQDFFAGCIAKAGAWAGEIRASDSAAPVMTFRFSALPPQGRLTIFADQPAPIVAIKLLLGLRLQDTLPTLSLRLATTLGTNALLERRGGKVLLLTTKGFEDLAEIGHQTRPDLFALHVQRPKPLHCGVLGVTERVAASGEILEPLIVDKAALQSALDTGVDNVAIALLNSHQNPRHEIELADMCRKMGFVSVARSGNRLQKLLPRTHAAIISAYLKPVLADYLRSLERYIPPDNIALMTSRGELTSVADFRGQDSILSGPAGGVMGMAAMGGTLVGLDMGGTSTDVCRWAGAVDYRYESEIAGHTLNEPMVDIDTVAAGGGSICWWDGFALKVGPKSAGAEPGPACYGRGGPLTVTDCALICGRIQPDFFPWPLDTAAARTRIEEEFKAIPGFQNLEELAAAWLQLAVTQMAEPLARLTAARGHKPADHDLIVFGGAGPQYACDIADRLQMRRIRIPQAASVFCASGLRFARETKRFSQHIARPLSDLHTVLSSLPSEVPGLVRTLTVRIRYHGAEHALDVTNPTSSTTCAAEFWRLHEQRYGFTIKDRALEIFEVHVIDQSPEMKERATSRPNHAEMPETTRRIFLDKEWSDWRVFGKFNGAALGPALFVTPNTTVVVPPGWRLSGEGDLFLERTTAVTQSHALNATPLSRSVFAGRLQSIATEMGSILEQSAVSLNIRERRDFSCAVFDRMGQLLVNAPHVPVHLGAMGATIRASMHLCTDDAAIVVCNDPYRGGSHLPDVTVLAPIRINGQNEFFVACRAHHAEIGGIVPGSMSPAAKNLAEEGVVIEPLRLDLVKDVAAIFKHSEFPSRDPATNVADLTAQAGSCERGRKLIELMVADWSLAAMQTHSADLISLAEAQARKTLAGVGDREFRDELEDGTPIVLKITSSTESVAFDFTGTGPQTETPFNAPDTVVRAATLYCVRLLNQTDMRLNEGLLAPIRFIIPQGSVIGPQTTATFVPPVAAGNVETSQRIVDVILGAFRVCAASQGTMNNVLLAVGPVSHYETLGGGAGAVANADGASAIHTHMTNTRITDPEVVEARLPIRIVHFGIRRHSGGAGAHRGGDGLIRHYLFSAAGQVTLISSRRNRGPYGAAGGQPGLPGRNLRIRAGQVETLPANCTVTVAPGDIIALETPGGGGYG